MAPSSTPSAPPPKSILKKTNPPPDAPSALELTGLTRAQAAQLLTLSKTELKPPIPIETFELLSAAFPSSQPPSPADISLLLSHLPDFSPSEYLDLIDERNCLNKCGYALCSNPRRNFPGKVKVRRSGVAKTEDLNKWCSDDCALKGMYIHVQLEHPSYEWVGDKGQMKVKIRLREDLEKEKGSVEVEKEVGRLSLDGASDERDKKGGDAHEKKQHAGRLAVERNGMSVDRVEITIGEKEITQPPTAPTFSSAQGGESGAHLVVEGYRIGSKGKKLKDTDGENDDDDDFIPSIRIESLNYGRS